MRRGNGERSLPLSLSRVPVSFCGGYASEKMLSNQSTIYKYSLLFMATFCIPARHPTAGLEPTWKMTWTVKTVSSLPAYFSPLTLI